VVRFTDGKCLSPDDESSEPHYRFRRFADERAVEVRADDRGNAGPSQYRQGVTGDEAARMVTVMRLDSPCRLVSCDTCGDVYDVALSGEAVHFPPGFSGDLTGMFSGKGVWKTDGDRSTCCHNRAVARPARDRAS